MFKKGTPFWRSLFSGKGELHMSRLHELTHLQRQFAEEHQDTVFRFLSHKNLSVEDYYDIVIFGYLQAVQEYDEDVSRPCLWRCRRRGGGSVRWRQRRVSCSALRRPTGAHTTTQVSAPLKEAVLIPMHGIFSRRFSPSRFTYLVEKKFVVLGLPLQFFHCHMHAVAPVVTRIGRYIEIGRASCRERVSFAV